MIDKLYAVVLIVTAFLWACLAAGRAYERFPNWYGIMLAGGSLVLGCHIITSIVRDRL